ncbi:hypothetical protein ACQW02_18875 [Humitalea sp. 24SJ18S-53]|uniref:hypothetical protein n=1 Tax=Humitalea sp. 24SJ18S-53 TaxID=3422307 RepID=UPI003D675123
MTSTSFGDQDVYAVGTSDVYQHGALVSRGTAAGPATVPMGRQTDFAPSVQAGYFRHFNDSRWIWGGKASYSNLASSDTVTDARLPQAGSFTYTASGITVPFTGNAIVQSYETTINQQIAAIPFIGRSYDRGFFYLGAGPTLSETRTNLNGLVGFADINGQRSDVSGAPQNFSTTGWTYGAAAVVGATYFITPSWFVDFNYIFSATNMAKGNYSSTFTNPNGVNGSLTSGTLVGNSSGSLTTQGVQLTINLAF